MAGADRTLACDRAGRHIDHGCPDNYRVRRLSRRLGTEVRTLWTVTVLLAAPWPSANRLLSELAAGQSASR
jgi:hypothetical protein